MTGYVQGAEMCLDPYYTKTLSISLFPGEEKSCMHFSLAHPTTVFMSLGFVLDTNIMIHMRTPASSIQSLKPTKGMLQLDLFYSSTVIGCGQRTHLSRLIQDLEAAFT